MHRTQHAIEDASCVSICVKPDAADLRNDVCKCRGIQACPRLPGGQFRRVPRDDLRNRCLEPKALLLPLRGARLVA